MEVGKTSGIQVIKIMVEIHELSAKLHCIETLFSTFQLCFHCLTLMYYLLSPASLAVLKVPMSELYTLPVGITSVSVMLCHSLLLLRRLLSYTISPL